MNVAAKCVSKKTDDSGSSVVFALNPNAIRTQQGNALEADVMVTMFFKNPASADEFTHGVFYTVEVHKQIVTAGD